MHLCIYIDIDIARCSHTGHANDLERWFSEEVHVLLAADDCINGLRAFDVGSMARYIVRQGRDRRVHFNVFETKCTSAQQKSADGPSARCPFVFGDASLGALPSTTRASWRRQCDAFEASLFSHSLAHTPTFNTDTSQRVPPCMFCTRIVSFRTHRDCNHARSPSTLCTADHLRGRGRNSARFLPSANVLGLLRFF